MSKRLSPSHQPTLADTVIDDERVAARTRARILITAPSSPQVETVARRVHMFSDCARFPFVETSAAALPADARALRTTCSTVLDAAAGGSVLLCDVEEMPRTVQGLLIELLASLALEREPSAAVRLVSGTTVSLLDRVVAGTFSERLFYQLNIIHLVVRSRLPIGEAM